MKLHYREHELAFRTQFAELKERTLQSGPLLSGTPGTLALRMGTGWSYWYRVFYPFAGKQSEEFVCKDGDEDILATMRERMAFASWAADQVSALRRLGFQVADKSVARVLVELYNRQAFAGGLVLVGTLAFMAWINELGIMTVAARTLDIDLARREPLELVAPLPLLATLQATGLPFTKVPGLPSHAPSTSVKLPGAQGLRVDLLAPGKRLGAIVATPELEWSAQAVPHYDYLLEDAVAATVLAGGHCIPVRVPQAARFVWHKLYASTQRHGFQEKAVKDRQQALLIGAFLARDDASSLMIAYAEAPSAMRDRIRSSRKVIEKDAETLPDLGELVKKCFAASSPKTGAKPARSKGVEPQATRPRKKT